MLGYLFYKSTKNSKDKIVFIKELYPNLFKSTLLYLIKVQSASNPIPS